MLSRGPKASVPLICHGCSASYYVEEGHLCTVDLLGPESATSSPDNDTKRTGRSATKCSPCHGDGHYLRGSEKVRCPLCRGTGMSHCNHGTPLHECRICNP